VEKKRDNPLNESRWGDFLLGILNKLPGVFREAEYAAAL
jgi:hypothetical protein